MLHAQLPSFSGGDRLGYFATYKDRDVEFGITSLCKVRYMPNLSKGLKSTFLGAKYTIDINPQLLTTKADGTPGFRKIVDESLTTPDKVSDNFEKTTITGEVTGGGKFEFNVQQNRGALVMGGRHTNPAETKPPHYFAIAIKVPEQLTDPKLEKYYELTAKAADDRAARRELKEFMRDFRDDKLSVRRIDGSESRYPLAEPIEGGTDAINGAGISELEMISNIYDGKRIVFTASEGSAITMKTSREGMLLPGFILTWKADPAKDPESKARVAVSIK
jgi:hypothetical protein